MLRACLHLKHSRSLAQYGLEPHLQPRHPSSSVARSRPICAVCSSRSSPIYLISVTARNLPVTANTPHIRRIASESRSSQARSPTSNSGWGWVFAVFQSIFPLLVPALCFAGIYIIDSPPERPEKRESLGNLQHGEFSSMWPREIAALVYAGMIEKQRDQPAAAQRLISKALTIAQKLPATSFPSPDARFWCITDLTIVLADIYPSLGHPEMAVITLLRAVFPLLHLRYRDSHSDPTGNANPAYMPVSNSGNLRTRVLFLHLARLARGDLPLQMRRDLFNTATWKLSVANIEAVVHDELKGKNSQRILNARPIPRAPEENVRASLRSIALPRWADFNTVQVLALMHEVQGQIHADGGDLLNAAKSYASAVDAAAICIDANAGPVFGNQTELHLGWYIIPPLDLGYEWVLDRCQLAETLSASLALLSTAVTTMDSELRASRPEDARRDLLALGEAQLRLADNALAQLPVAQNHSPLFPLPRAVEARMKEAVFQLHSNMAIYAQATGQYAKARKHFVAVGLRVTGSPANRTPAAALLRDEA